MHNGSSSVNPAQQGCVGQVPAPVLCTQNPLSHRLQDVKASFPTPQSQMSQVVSKNSAQQDCESSSHLCLEEEATPVGRETTKIDLDSFFASYKEFVENPVFDMGQLELLELMRQKATMDYGVEAVKKIEDEFSERLLSKARRQQVKEFSLNPAAREWHPNPPATIDFDDDAWDMREVTYSGPPPYNKRLSVRRQIPVMAFSFDDFLAAGWPAQVAKAVIAIQDRELRRGPKAPKSAAVVAREDSKVADPYIWIVPRHKPHPRIPKPIEYNVHTFRKWVFGEATALLPEKMTKGVFVCGSPCTKILFNGASHVSRSYLSRLLSLATVYVHDFTAKEIRSAPQPLRIKDFVKPEDMHFIKERSLTLKGVTYVKEDWDSARVHFPARLDKLFIWCRAYLHGSESADGRYLQSRLDSEDFRNSAVSHLIIMGQKVEKLGHLTKLKSHLPRDLYKRCEKHLRGQLERGLQDDLNKLKFSTETIPQGFFDTSFRHDLHFHFPEMATALGASEAAAMRLLRLSSLIAGVLSATSWISVMASIGAFVGGEPKMSRFFEQLVARLPSVLVVPQSGWLFTAIGEAAHELWTVLTGFTISAVIASIKEEVTGCLGPMVMSFIAETRKAIRVESAKAAAKAIIDWTKSFFARAHSAWQIGDISPLWGPAWDPQLWIRDANVLVDYQTVLVSDSPSPSDLKNLEKFRNEKLIGDQWIVPVSPAIFKIEALAHATRGRELIAYFSFDPQIVAALSRALNRLVGFVDLFSVSSALSADRVRPYVIVLHGKPGVGKTALATKLFKAIGKKLGYGTGEECRYKWQVGTNFQDGFNHTQWCVFMDDVDQGVAAPTAGFPTHAEVIINLCNTSPFPVEQANVDMKGKVFARPRLVIICTNYEDMNIPKVCMEPHAVYRRFDRWVEVGVLDDFADKNGQIDPAKVTNCRTHNFQSLGVSQYKRNESKPEDFKSNPRMLSLSQFLKELHADMETKLNNGLAQLRATSAEVDTCPECGLDTTLDCCSSRQMNVSPVNALAAVSSISLSWMAWMAAARIATERALRDWKKRLMAHLKPIVMATTAAVALIALCWKSVDYMFQARFGEIETEGWVRAAQTYKPGIPGFNRASWTKDDIVRVIREAYCEIRIDGAPGMHAFVVSPQAVLVPTHLFQAKGKLQLVQNSRVIDIPTPARFVPLTNPELCVCYIPGLTPGLTITKKVLKDFDASIRNFDEAEIWTKDCIFKPDSAWAAVRTYPVVCTSAPTESGNCGAVYLVRFNTSWFIGGMHYALVNTTSVLGTTSFSMAGALSTIDISAALTTLAAPAADVVAVSHSIAKVPEAVQVGRYQNKSEVWAAITNQGADVTQCGLLSPALPGSTMKSKIRHSIYAEDLADVANQFCGESGYWRIPNFRGSMDSGVWESPFTNMFLTQNKAHPDQDLMWLAVADYISGMQDLSLDGYIELSEEQTLTGIPGSYVNAINMKTSVGPPYAQGKYHHISLDREEGSYMSADVVAMNKEIEDILALGDVPCPLGLCTLKDEPVKPNKVPRVFICLPFSYNFVLKKKGIWKSFMRANPGFFESAVGVNMTSHECEFVLNHLDRIRGGILYDGDIKAMDKSWCAEMFDAVAYVVYAISFAIGVAPKDNYLLILGLKNTLYSIKNDLFKMTMNPSGCDCTVELNGICLSICERYLYYKVRGYAHMDKIATWRKSFFESPLHTLPDLTFRENIALLHYGDDNLKMCRYPLPDNYIQLWYDELGMVMTDSAKREQFAPCTTVNFLKRNITYDPKLGCAVGQLERKSLARMMMMKKDSSLSDIDHAAVAASEILRELVYYGEDEYNRFLTIFRSLAEKYAFARNPYFENKPYSHWVEKIRERSFRTWIVRTPDATDASEGELTYQMNENISVKTATEAVGAMPSNNGGGESTNIGFEAGAVAVHNPVSFAHLEVEPTFTQQFPDTTLKDFMQRATKIASVNISSADATGGAVLQIDPWMAYLANPVIADKTKNFAFIRGTLQVIGVVTCPGGGYGFYMVSALPNAGCAAFVTCNYPNALQVDHCARIDCSAATDFVFQLPFIWPYDYAGLNGAADPPANMYNLEIHCGLPLRTAIPGGVTTGTITLYANLMDDYSMVVPYLQGKHKAHPHGLKVNAALKALAPATHAIIADGQGSKMAGTLAGVAETLSKVPVIGPAAAVVGQGARAAEQVLSWFGFTREKITPAIAPFYTVSVSSVTSVDVDDGSQVAALTTNNSISIDPRLAGFGGVDVASFDDLIRRWTLVREIPWTTEQTAGTILGVVPVTPFYMSTNNHVTLALSPAGYIGLPFEWWRCDMEYMVIIPVSKFHRGVVQIAWIPSGASIVADPTNTSMNIIHDVTSDVDPTLQVGYARAEPFLKVRLMSDNMPIIPYAAGNGTLTFRVVNPLVAQTLANTKIFVFARSKNLDVQVPSHSKAWYDAEGEPIEFDFWSQTTLQREVVELQGALGDDSEEEETHALVPFAGALPSDQLYFGERVQSVRALMQKPTRMGRIVNLSQFIFQPLRMGPDLVYPVGTPVCPMTYAYYYANLFSGVAASERFKMMPNFNNKHFIGMGRYPSSYTVPANKYIPITPFSYSGPQQGYEVEIPYYRPEKYVIPWFDAAIPEMNVLQFDRVLTTRCEGWYSFGPDIRLTCFCQVPVITLLSTVPTPLAFGMWV